MSLPIFFHSDLVDGDLVTLTEETSKHVVQVLRMHTGEALNLADGKGNLYTCKVVDAHKKHCTVKVEQHSFQPAPARQVSIAISLLKNTSRFEWFLEKATEIGVTEIIPFISQRTEKQRSRYDRMHQILVAAMLQSQQVWLPVLHEPKDLDNVIKTSSYNDKLIAHCVEDSKKDLRSFYNSASVQILIGPEGDFSKEEIDMAMSNGFIPVTLGSTRLRAETAGMVAATLLCI